MNPDIEAYIELLLKHYELDRDALVQLWSENLLTKNMESNPLINLKLTELKEMCKAKGLPLSGTKQALVERLTNHKKRDEKGEREEDEESGEKALKISRVKGVKQVKKGKEVKEGKKRKSTIADILVKLSSNKEKVHIRRNLFDHYEHMETGLVFDEITEKVIGKQMEDGDVGALTETDMEVCKERGFDFDVPDLIQ